MSKWFDSRLKNSEVFSLPRPTPLLQVYSASALDLQNLIAATSRPGPSVSKMLRMLAEMPPAARLARNLKVTLEMLSKNDARGPLAGLTQSELEILLFVERLGLTVELRMTAESLFNVYERYQLVLSLAPLFRMERSREQHRLDPVC